MNSLLARLHRSRASHWALALVFFGFVAVSQAEAAQAGRWSEEQAREWQQRNGWLAGCNFLPSSAINQLEMFQAESFDPVTIDRELAWAESIGFNSVRVFLHHMLWEQDAEGFSKRLDQFLTIAEKHHIGAMLVLFDSCWDPFPKLGPQRAPRPHVHNSGWVQSPGAEVLRDSTRYPALKSYVVGAVGRFRDDKRIQVWDVWNEPDNMNGSSYKKLEPENKVALVLPLLKQAFGWAREARASQPLTSGVWVGTWAKEGKLSAIEEVQLGESDLISFHNYNEVAGLTEAILNLKRFNRPLLCTEYMSRGNGSFFKPHLAYLKSQGVAAYNWGLVDGKSQTIYPWDSWSKSYTGAPELWFHDIFRRDGTAYRAEEVEYIRGVTLKKAELRSGR